MLGPNHFVTHGLQVEHPSQLLEGRKINYYQIDVKVNSFRVRPRIIASSVDKMTTETRPNMLCQFKILLLTHKFTFPMLTPSESKFLSKIVFKL